MSAGREATSCDLLVLWVNRVCAWRMRCGLDRPQNVGLWGLWDAAVRDLQGRVLSPADRGHPRDIFWSIFLKIGRTASERIVHKFSLPGRKLDGALDTSSNAVRPDTSMDRISKNECSQSITLWSQGLIHRMRLPLGISTVGLPLLQKEGVSLGLVSCSNRRARPSAQGHRQGRGRLMIFRYFLAHYWSIRTDSLKNTWTFTLFQRVLWY